MRVLPTGTGRIGAVKPKFGGPAPGPLILKKVDDWQLKLGKILPAFSQVGSAFAEAKNTTKIKGLPFPFLNNNKNDQV